MAGLVLYVFSLFLIAFYFIKGEMLISSNIIILVISVLLILILFNEKLTQVIVKKKQKETTPVVEKIFEIIEMLLSFASNTISFLRLAAFAINHVGLCMAIYLLANMTNSAGNILISVIGNIVVLVLEGLIVGIQILRLEYYELFSRFYSGDGVEYNSIQKQTSN